MTSLLRATASGEQHGLINTLTNSVVFDDFKHMAPHIKAKLEKEKKEDAKIVKVEYLNSRGRHERLTKPYCRYSGDPINVWHMIPGQVYDVPMGFVKEVNENEGKRVKRSGLLEVDGKNATESGAPLDKDTPADWLHRLVPAGF
jgi:hypothetical protein